MKKLLLLTVLCLSFSFCAKKNDLSEFTAENHEKSPPSIKELVWKYGFDTVNMRQMGDTLIVNGDIAISEKRLRDEYEYEISTKPRQAVIYSHTILNDSDIKIYISPSFSASDQLIIKDALSEFTNTKLSPYDGFVSVTFVTSAGSAHATISTYYENSNTCGYAAFPTTEKNLPPPLATRWYIGEYMNINTYFFNSMTNSQKKLLIAHEFGHMIGIRHTNWRGLGEPKFTTFNGKSIGAYTVVGTNNTSNNPDPSSVFNGANCLTNWYGFTDGDKKTIQAVINGDFWSIDPFSIDPEKPSIAPY